MTSDSKSTMLEEIARKQKDQPQGAGLFVFEKLTFFFGLSLLTQTCFPGMAGRPVRRGPAKPLAATTEAAAERRCLAGWRCAGLPGIIRDRDGTSPVL